jgi:hypothetical protein
MKSIVAERAPAAVAHGGMLFIVAGFRRLDGPLEIFRQIKHHGGVASALDFLSIRRLNKLNNTLTHLEVNHSYECERA